MSIISEMMSYPFIVRALIGGVLVSLCASLLGVSLVLKRYSMIGDGLSHVSFGALSVALAAGWSPLKISIPVVVLAAFFLLRITERGKIKSDAAIAMISASALAIGIIAVSYTHLSPSRPTSHGDGRLSHPPHHTGPGPFRTRPPNLS